MKTKEELAKEYAHSSERYVDYYYDISETKDAFIAGYEAAEKIYEERMNKICCRLDEEFICGIVRNRSGIDSGELDFTIRCERAEADIDNVIEEVERLLYSLKGIRQEINDERI